MIAPIAPANTPEWLRLRKSGIGASEAAAACGLSRYATPLDVFNEKRGLTSKSETEAMRLGTLMEPVIATEFVCRTGLQLQPSPGLFRHPKRHWQLASPDGFISGRSETLGAEFKNTTSRNSELGEPGTDQVPFEWICQAQQQMAVCDLPAVMFGVLVDGFDFRTYTVNRDDRVIDRISEREAVLWDMIQRGDAPPIDSCHPAALDAVQNAFRHADDDTAQVELDDEAERLWEEYLSLSYTEAEKRRKVIKAELLQRIGPARHATLPSGERLTRNVGEDSYVPGHNRKGSVTITSNIKVR